VVYCDEVQDLGGLRKPNLGLSMHLDELYRKDDLATCQSLRLLRLPDMCPLRSMIMLIRLDRQTRR